jgi:ATP-dependent helicase HrpB
VADSGAAMERQLPPAARRLLEEIAPERIRLALAAAHVRVHYQAGQPPWIASRLQDFFGMRETPTVARGAVPVVVRCSRPISARCR